MKSHVIRRSMQIVLLFVLLVVALPASARWDGGPGTGPGGVGSTDGSSSLELWLTGNAGVYSDTGCSTAVTTDGSNVSCWGDQSGNGNHVTQATGPTFENDAGNAINNNPVLEFNGSVQLEREVTNTTTNFTLMAVAVPPASPVEDSTIFSSVASVGAFPRNSTQLDIGGPTRGCTGQYRANVVNSSNVQQSICAGTADTTPRLITVLWNGTTINTWNNGTAQGSAIVSSYSPLFDDLRIGVNRNSTTRWANDIAEVVLYWQTINTAQRVLVENYLAARYSLTISNDRYDGDDGANGDFDLDVGGIGRDGGASHTEAHSAGMIVVNGSFLQNDGDYLMFGHNTAANDNTTADLPTTGDWATAPAPQRWIRHWYIQVTDAGTTGGTVTISFDLSEAGMVNGPAGPVFNYRLLGRSGTTGQFTDIATATALFGDRIVFGGVDVSLLGSNFTVGTLDANASPTNITLNQLTAESAPMMVWAFPLVVLAVISLAWLRLRWSRQTN